MVERRASVAAGGRRISVSGHLATLGRPGSSGGGAKAGGDDSKPLQPQQQTRRSMMMRRSMVASGGASGGTLPPASGPVGSGGGVGASRVSMLSKSSSVPAVGSGGARVSIMASKSSGRASMVSPMLPKRRPVLRGAPVPDAAVRAVLSKPFEARTYDDIRVVRRRLVSMGLGRRLFDSEMGAHPFRVDEVNYGTAARPLRHRRATGTLACACDGSHHASVRSETRADARCALKVAHPPPLRHC